MGYKMIFSTSNEILQSFCKNDLLMPSQKCIPLPAIDDLHAQNYPNSKCRTVPLILSKYLYKRNTTRSYHSVTGKNTGSASALWCRKIMSPVCNIPPTASRTKDLCICSDCWSIKAKFATITSALIRGYLYTVLLIFLSSIWALT